MAESKKRCAALCGVALVAMLGCSGGSGGDGDPAAGGGIGTGGGAGADAGAAPQAFRVSGAAVDTHGRPLAGAQLAVCNPLYVNSCITGTSGSDGRYSFELPANNVWNASASILKTFNGKSHCMELAPDGTATFASSDGAIRNFAWKLSGLRPDAPPGNLYASYYGVAATVDTGDFNSPVPLDHVRVSFTPIGSLVDGSAGQAFTANAGDWSGYVVGNIPLGRYTITAEYAPAGAASVALLVGTRFGIGTYRSSATLDFEPPVAGTCTVASEATIYVAFP